MSKYKHHKYTWTNRFGSVRHQWELVGPIGAIHFHVSVSDDARWEPSAGLEYHHTEASGYRPGEAPDHIDCPLTGGRCWHDGTSLYASEHVWPFCEPYLRTGDHKTIFSYLERIADSHFDEMATAMRLKAAGCE